MQLGKYTLGEKLAEGGMGEIYLATDTSCERTVALKRIKPSLATHERIRFRFLQEAKLSARLSHPTIIPIYEIHGEGECYYTMPYVKGQTLKEILRKTKEFEKAGSPPHPIGSSIPQLVRIFLSICQGVDYSHTNGTLHRDLKAENVLVGLFGEVLIIDWGLACGIKESDDAPLLSAEEMRVLDVEKQLTLPGKVVGTVAYMAPERAHGKAASVSTDIYSLGVILYQILTLTLPFKRASLKDLKKKGEHETFLDPCEIAPHRDIPEQLIHVIKKCLAFKQEDRYESVHMLIADIERYIEGSPEWNFSRSLSIESSEDWEFQENILLAKHIAITRFTDVMEWVMLMISKESFTGNTKISFTYTPHSATFGIGVLCNIPRPHERKSLEDGYLVWLGNNETSGLTLFRSNVEVSHANDFHIEAGKTYSVTVEKIDNLLTVYVNDTLVVSYMSHMPMVGGHIGLLYRDAHFTLSSITISSGSRSVMVNCLTLPDAFLNSHDYDTAIEEYRKIAASFRGRLEGREAIFRAGLALIEKGKLQKFSPQKAGLFSLAVEEFSKLHGTPGAPLEYLGKSLVYRAENDLEEEMKCLELGVRRFRKHPLLHILEEHILFRMLEAAQSSRKAAYHFALLALKLLPRIVEQNQAKQFFSSLKKHMEVPYFIEPLPSSASSHARNVELSILLSFWLAKPMALYEIINTLSEEHVERPILIANALYALIELSKKPLALKTLSELSTTLLFYRPWIETTSLATAFSRLTPSPHFYEIRHIVSLMREYLTPEKAGDILPFFPRFKTVALNMQEMTLLKHTYIWALLLTGNTTKAGENLRNFSAEAISSTSSSFFVLYGCYLMKAEGEEIGKIHFDAAEESNHPSLGGLMSLLIQGKIDIFSVSEKWEQEAFFFEKKELVRYALLYYFLTGKRRKYSLALKLLEKLSSPDLPLF